MKSVFVILISISFFLSGFAEDAIKTLPKSTDPILAELNGAKTDATAKAVKKLQKIQIELTKRGDLDGALAVKSLIENLSKSSDDEKSQQAILTIDRMIQAGGPIQKFSDGLILSGNARITSPGIYKAPYQVTVIAQIETTDLRIGVAGLQQVIFNWADNPSELRIDGGILDKRHMLGAGQIPVGQWVKITIDVSLSDFSISVNDKERYRVKADFSTIESPISIFPGGSTIRVKSVSTTSGDMKK
jgi:hypothetical protein